MFSEDIIRNNLTALHVLIYVQWTLYISGFYIDEFNKLLIKNNYLCIEHVDFSPCSLKVEVYGLFRDTSIVLYIVGNLG